MRTTPLAVACLLVACAKDDPGVVVIFDGPGRGDLSFSDMAAVGIDRAKDEVEGLSVTEIIGEDETDPVGAALAVEGATLVIAVGFAFAEDMDEAAPDNPDVHFAAVDGTLAAADNTVSLLFAEEQGSFLVGAAAGLKSTSHEIGFVGGVDMDLIHKFEAGVVAGVAQVDATATVTVDYLSPEGDFSGFDCPECAEASALAMYTAGADIVYHASGKSGIGVFAAAESYSEDNSTHVWAIGVDTDQYLLAETSQQPHILTSMLKRVDTAVYETIRQEVDGEFESGTRVFDLSNDGVGYATSGGFVDDIATQLDGFAEDIIDGTIVVPTSP